MAELSATPIAAVDDRGGLSSTLWSSFAMSSVPSGAWLEPERLARNAALRGALLFCDTTASPAKSGFGSFKLPSFGKKAAVSPLGPLAPLEEAGEELLHAFVLCEAADVAKCVSDIEGLASCAPTTVIAPMDGVTLASTKGWIQKTVQDHEGVLVGGLAVEAGYTYDEKGNGELTSVRLPPGASSSLPREDFAELAVQCALRLARTIDGGAPRLRVVRVAASGETAERAVKNYDSIIAGPKFRARQGTVQSADWSALLAPFGVARMSDPSDWRLLVDVAPQKPAMPTPGLAEAAETSDGGRGAAAAPPSVPSAGEEALTVAVAKAAADTKFGVAMTGIPDTGVVVTRFLPNSLLEAAGLQVGDTIAAINGDAVSTSKEATKLLQAAPTGTVTLQVVRGRDVAAWVVG